MGKAVGSAPDFFPWPSFWGFSCSWSMDRSVNSFTACPCLVGVHSVPCKHVFGHGKAPVLLSARLGEDGGDEYSAIEMVGEDAIVGLVGRFHEPKFRNCYCEGHSLI